MIRRRTRAQSVKALETFDAPELAIETCILFLQPTPHPAGPVQIKQTYLHLVADFAQHARRRQCVEDGRAALSVRRPLHTIAAHSPAVWRHLNVVTYDGQRVQLAGSIV